MEFEELEHHHKGEKKEYFKYGEDYYRSRNTYIMNRSKRIYLDGIGITENPFGSNHKLPSGHFKKIVDQKVMYLLGEGADFSNEGQSEEIDKYFEDTFDETLIDMGVESSKKGQAWLYAFKVNNQLKFTMIPAEQLTPIYDEYNQLEKMIRRYDSEQYQYMSVYDSEQVVVYRKERKETDFKMIAVYGHWSEVQEFNGEQVGEPLQHGFGTVPFFPLWNNKEKLSDLFNIKQLIDTYDIINSDFANNIDDMQDAYFTLKGYSGEGKNLGEFMRQLKMYKAVPISEDGDLQANQLQIPTEARQVFLTRLEKDIYKFAMAVDLSNFQGGSITNVYIKSMFADLDLKCDQFESEVRKFIYKIIDFINMVDNKNFTKDVHFERSMIVNRQEIIDGIVKLSGILSQQTIMELLPYEIDMDQEKERLNEERGAISLEETLTQLQQPTETTQGTE